MGERKSCAVWLISRMAVSVVVTLELRMLRPVACDRCVVALVTEISAGSSIEGQVVNKTAQSSVERPVFSGTPSRQWTGTSVDRGVSVESRGVSGRMNGAIGEHTVMVGSTVDAPLPYQMCRSGMSMTVVP